VLGVVVNVLGLMRTVIAIDPTTQTRGLLIEIYSDLDDATEPLLVEFCRRLYDQSMRVGLVVARRQTVVVRDTLSHMDFSRNRFEATVLDTAALFEAARLAMPSAGERFIAQVENWLAATARSWHSTLPDSAIAAMVPDVVGHLAGAAFHTEDDVAAAE
jgi:hypothetical protein